MVELSNVLIYGRNKEISAWAAQKLGLAQYEPATAIGIGRNGKVIGAALYNNYYIGHMGQPISIEMSIVTLDKKWCTRHTLRKLLEYPFIQLKLERIQATTSKRDKSTRRFLEKLGFKLEGIGRKAFYKGGDSAVYSMLRHECKWIRGNTICQKDLQHQQLRPLTSK